MQTSLDLSEGTQRDTNRLRRELANKLEAVRLEKGLSFSEIAEMTGYSKSHIAQLFHMPLCLTGLPCYVAVAHALGLKIKISVERP